MAKVLFLPIGRLEQDIIIIKNWMLCTLRMCMYDLCARLGIFTLLGPGTDAKYESKGPQVVLALGGV